MSRHLVNELTNLLALCIAKHYIPDTGLALYMIYSERGHFVKVFSLTLIRNVSSQLWSVPTSD